MVSDDSVEKKGFSSTWDTFCGENPFDEKYGTIQNRKFGTGNYLPNQNCVWNVSSSDSDDMIEMKFLNLMIEDNPLCSNDYLAFYKERKINFRT